MTEAAPSAARGRLLILLAAVLWSLSGAFTKALTRPLPVGLHVPELSPLQIAAWRAVFAAAVLAPLVRPRHLTCTRATIITALAFAAMNGLFVTAVAVGKAGNAILLQYTAPMWVYLFAVGLGGERGDRRGAQALLIVLAGIVVIVVGGWQGGEIVPVLLGLGSGLTYAVVLLGLRAQRGASPAWLTVVNHLVAGAVLLPYALTQTTPRPAQFLTLFLFGAVQMGLPYWLMARGLRSVGPQEAGTLSLIEPLLQPLWAYLVTRATPEPEVPDGYTYLGGALILVALLYRYWPRRPGAGLTTKQAVE